ncbi:MAG: hypothetical protein EA353_07835 [Puniceicoccaceae bacterium]|nr:MAG: hypothetical protein EA353_07835 [Puniceicoccaceae bacterium]
MPEALMQRVKIVAAKRKTTFRALVVDALERTLDEPRQLFELEDASVGTEEANTVSNDTINQWIDTQRESHFNP